MANINIDNFIGDLNVIYCSKNNSPYQRKAIQAGIEALKKQKGVKPIGGNCPYCMTSLAAHHTINFCTACGQKINWINNQFVKEA